MHSYYKLSDPTRAKIEKNDNWMVFDVDNALNEMIANEFFRRQAPLAAREWLQCRNTVRSLGFKLVYGVKVLHEGISRCLLIYFYHR